MAELLAHSTGGGVMEALDAVEFERRFKARIVDRLKPFKAEGHKGRGWTQAQAEDAANAEWESADVDDWLTLDTSPEAAADESLSYWGEG